MKEKRKKKRICRNCNKSYEDKIKKVFLPKLPNYLKLSPQNKN